VQSLCPEHRARFHGEKRAGTFRGKTNKYNFLKLFVSEMFFIPGDD